MTLPNFVATCVDDSDVIFYGEGVTVDEAFKEFLSSGSFHDNCDYYETEKGVLIDVMIYTVIRPEDSEYHVDDINPDWKWVLDDKIETRKVISV